MRAPGIYGCHHVARHALTTISDAGTLPVLFAQVYVLDERMRPVPLGVPGRLYVSGVCLARGYLHKPQLTAEAFIANPFFDPFLDSPAFSRMFDTRVLSRWLPGGMLDFVGHADRQVGPVASSVDLHHR